MNLIKSKLHPLSQVLTSMPIRIADDRKTVIELEKHLRSCNMIEITIDIPTAISNLPMHGTSNLQVI
jgi:hypothetical protein